VQLAPLFAKGIAQSGPETVTENDTEAKDIEEGKSDVTLPLTEFRLQGSGILDVGRKEIVHVALRYTEADRGDMGCVSGAEDDEDKSQKSSSSTVHSLELSAGAPTSLSTGPKPQPSNPPAPEAVLSSEALPNGIEALVCDLSVNTPKAGINGKIDATKISANGMPVRPGSSLPTPSIHARISMNSSGRFASAGTGHMQC